jgi:hypothetical protein
MRPPESTVETHRLADFGVAFALVSSNTFPGQELSMSKEKTPSIAVGDHIAWNTTQGKTRGVVTKKLTRTAKARGHIAKPSKREPQYEVKSEKSGKTAIHKPQALARLANEASKKN